MVVKYVIIFDFEYTISLVLFQNHDEGALFDFHHDVLSQNLNEFEWYLLCPVELGYVHSLLDCFFSLTRGWFSLFR